MSTGEFVRWLKERSAIRQITDGDPLESAVDEARDLVTARLVDEGTHLRGTVVRPQDDVTMLVTEKVCP